MSKQCITPMDDDNEEDEEDGDEDGLIGNIIDGNDRSGNELC